MSSYSTQSIIVEQRQRDSSVVVLCTVHVPPPGHRPRALSESRRGGMR